MSRKTVNIKVVYGVAPRSHISFAVDKAPGDLILQMQALNLFENIIICST